MPLINAESKTFKLSSLRDNQGLGDIWDDISRFLQNLALMLLLEVR